MRPNVQIALDLATQCGYAIGAPGETPIHGSASLRSSSTHAGAKMCVLIDWLAPHIEEHRPVRIIYEAPLLMMPKSDDRGSGGNAATMENLIGMAKMVDMLACRWDVPVVKTASSTVRKFFVGHGRPKDPKMAVVNECIRRGWNPRDDNDADALATLAYAHDLYFPQLVRSIAR